MTIVAPRPASTRMRAPFVACCVVVVCAGFAFSAEAQQRTNVARERAHEQGRKQFRSGEFAKAAETFEKELALLFDSERGTPVELSARENLVLALYAAKKLPAAYKQYQKLLDTFAAHRFDADSVLQETIDDLERHVSRRAAVVRDSSAPTPTELSAAPASVPQVNAPFDQPKALKTAASERRWHWYYLTPLGIGQFLAGSPVRGAIFTVTQLGFLVANIAGMIVFRQQTNAALQADDPARAEAAQLAMNIGFFGAIAAVTAGLIDGIFFEP